MQNNKKKIQSFCLCVDVNENVLLWRVEYSSDRPNRSSAVHTKFKVRHCDEADTLLFLNRLNADIIHSSIIIVFDSRAILRIIFPHFFFLVVQLFSWFGRRFIYSWLEEFFVPIKFICLSLSSFSFRCEHGQDETSSTDVRIDECELVDIMTELLLQEREDEK